MIMIMIMIIQFWDAGVKIVCLSLLHYLPLEAKTLLQKKATQVAEPPTDISLNDKSGVYKIIVKKRPYQLLNTNHEFFPSFDASSFHNLFNESS